MELKQIEQETQKAVNEVLAQAKLKMGDLFVIGCSTSEVGGQKIGSASSMDIAGAIYRGAYAALEPHGIYLAAQCCEHLNRALILEREAADKRGYEPVNVKPQPKAGGSFATAAYNSFRHPVALEESKADAGLDIGGTLIGMHLKKVAVPVRLDQNHIGSAIVLAARVRPKFIGGERAVYDNDLKDGYPDFT